MMQKFLIKGGKKVSGEINVSGAKNAALPIMVAAILGDSPSIIKNVPVLRDTEFMLTILENLGAKVNFDKEKNEVKIDPRSIDNLEAPYELVRKMRASIYVLGPLVSKYGKAKVSLPGGCNWGPRPIDLHLKGMEMLGAEYDLEHGYISMNAEKLVGKEIYLDKVSVGATANLMMAAVLAKGKTTIINAAKEPEIVNLGHFLNLMGAEIRGLGSNEVTIDGVEHLSGAEFSVIPDRIEAGTFMILAALCGEKVKINNIDTNHLSAVIDKMTEMNIKIDMYGNSLEITSPSKLKPVEVITGPYPGIPTDLQAQFMVLMTQAEGASIIKETIYHDRFAHVPELNRLGARIKLEDNTALITGKAEMSGAEIMASDLRAGAALVLGGCLAEGETIVNRIYHIDRGYENFEDKLRNLGINIERMSY